MEERARNSILEFETLFSDFRELLNGSGLNRVRLIRVRLVWVNLNPIHTYQRSIHWLLSSPNWNHFQFFAASSILLSYSLAVLLEVKTTHSSAVLILHLSQCFTPPLKSIPASFFPHTPCPPSWIPSLPVILTPVLRMCHLFRTTYATRSACLSTDPIWWGHFLRRGKSLKGGQTLGAWVWSLTDLVFGKSVRCLCGYLPMGRCHFLTGCVLFWEMDPIFFGWERVNHLWYGRGKINPVCVLPVGICWLVVVKRKKPTASWRRLSW